MKLEAQQPFNFLIETLQQIVRVYRELLTAVRSEKEILIAARLDDLNENNRVKETIINKIRALEDARIRYTQDLTGSLGLQGAPSVTDISIRIGGAEGERLQSVFQTLELLMKRVKDLNGENEILVKSALNNINGAMRALKDALNEKVTYEKKGDYRDPSASGRLVSKQV